MASQTSGSSSTTRMRLCGKAGICIGVNPYITDAGPFSSQIWHDITTHELVLSPGCDYSCSVKPRLFSRSALGLIVIGLLLAPSPARAQVKPIRLRNGVIPAQASQPSSNQAKSALAQPPVSGLFLVQFSSPPGREARDQLAAIGVDLLHYVPEDTFV